LNALRIKFDQGIGDKGIEPCPCGKPDCPTFIISHAYCVALETEKDKALRHARAAWGFLRSSRT